MYKSIIIMFSLIILFLSCNVKQPVHNESITKQIKPKNDTLYVYKDGKIISPLIKNVYNSDCDGCYVHKTITVYNKGITFLVPVTQNSRRFDTQFVIKKINLEDKAIIKIKNVGTGIQYLNLHVIDNGNNLKAEKIYKIYKDSYKKKIGEQDYNHLPAMKICKINYNKVLKDTLHVSVITEIDIEEKQCTYCIIEESDFENCFNKAKNN